MDQFRDQRLLIPGGVFLLSLTLLVLAANGFSLPVPIEQGSQFGAIVAALLSSLPLGFLLTTASVGFCQLILHATPFDSLLKSRLPDDLRASSRLQTYAEIDARIHSWCPESLRGFLTRRLTNSYTCWSSLFGIACAFVVFSLVPWNSSGLVPADSFRVPWGMCFALAASGAVLSIAGAIAFVEHRRATLVWLRWFSTWYDRDSRVPPHEANITERRPPYRDVEAIADPKWEPAVHWSVVLALALLADLGLAAALAENHALLFGVSQLVIHCAAAVAAICPELWPSTGFHWRARR